MIRPPHAAYVWSDADNIWLEFPSTVGGQTTMVHLPNDAAGLARVLEIIASRHARSTIATPGTPTQQQVLTAEEWLKHNKPTRPISKVAPALKEAARALLRRRGIV